MFNYSYSFFKIETSTAQKVDSTGPSSRVKTKGKIDVLVALAGGALSGMVVANVSYATLSLAGYQSKQ